MQQDTIAAIATAPGNGGVGIVRVSGPDARRIGEGIAGQSLTPRLALYTPFKHSDGALIDQGIALYFANPNSFTGEDIVELQGHGGSIVMQQLLQECLSLGARLAKPGEFSERAFLNNKIDLAQAEAIADLISSSSEQAAKAALSSLKGEFSSQVHQLVEQLITLRIYVEAAIDFPEEEIDFLSDGHVANQLEGIRRQFKTISDAAQQGKLMRDGMTLVLIGQPNVGKSSLLNRFTGEETAIVTAQAGTTRDVLREHIHIDGMPVHIVDTAGLRDTDDIVEQEGIRRAKQALASADHVLVLVDAQTGLGDSEQQALNELPQSLSATLVINKTDLADYSPNNLPGNIHSSIKISAKQGDGLTELKNHLKQKMGYNGGETAAFSARQRHLDALSSARQHVENSAVQLYEFAAGELVAEELKLAQNALQEITGEFTSDDLLGEIFSSFCIGK